MNPEEDARATWELLDETERKALACLGTTQTVITPQGLGRHLGVTWQHAAAVAKGLKELGLVKITSLPKQTSYDITGQGRMCLKFQRPVTDLEAL
jgi:predicted transcriptional regulator